MHFERLVRPELEQLLVFSRDRKAQTPICLVEGPSGSGKSALLTGFCAESADMTAVYGGSCRHVKVPFGPLSLVIKKIAVLIREEAPVLMEQHRFELHTVAPGVVPHPPVGLLENTLPDERIRLPAPDSMPRVIHGILRFLVEAHQASVTLQKKPLALLIDDIEHADPLLTGFVMMFRNYSDLMPSALILSATQATKVIDQLDPYRIPIAPLDNATIAQLVPIELKARINPAELAEVSGGNVRLIDHALAWYRNNPNGTPPAADRLTRGNWFDLPFEHQQKVLDDLLDTPGGERAWSFETVDAMTLQKGHRERMTRLAAQASSSSAELAMITHHGRSAGALDSVLPHLNKYARRCLDTGMYEIAIQLGFEQLNIARRVKNQELLFEAIRTISAALVAVGQTQEALKFLQYALDSQAPASVRAYALYSLAVLSVQYIATPDIPRARQYLAQLHEVIAGLSDPESAAFENARALNAAALVEMKEGNAEKALSLCDQALRALSALPKNRHLPLRILILVNMFRLAQSTRDEFIPLAYLDEAIALDPHFADYWVMRASFRVQHHDLQVALDDLNHAAAIAPASVSLLQLRAQVLTALGRPEEAARDLDLSRRMMPRATAEK